MFGLFRHIEAIWALFLLLGIALSGASCSTKPKEPLQVQVTYGWHLSMPGDARKFPAQVPGSWRVDMATLGLDTVQLNSLKDNSTPAFYETKFRLHHDFMDRDSIYLHLKGLRGKAKIIWNEQVLGETNTKTLNYRFQVREKGFEGNNQLRIEFLTRDTAFRGISEGVFVETN